MASQDPSLRHSVCPKHPDRAAVGRCAVCFKPVCDECLIRTGQSAFCSQDCVEKFERTRQGVNAWHAQGQREAARRRRRLLVRLVVLLVVAVLAYLYLTSHPGGLRQLLDSARRAIRDTIPAPGR